VVTGGTGRPPVVMTSGLGGTWLDWISVVPLVAARHQIVRFDRPGLGYSPRLPHGPSLRAEADRIAALARTFAPGERIVVAAHSMAAFHAEAFARLYPDLTGALVLVDPSYEPAPDRLSPRMRTALSELASRAGLLTGRAAGVLGLARAMAPPARAFGVVQATVRRADPVPAADARPAYGTGDAVGATLAELACYRWQADDLARLREQQPFPAVPLVVLAATGRLHSDQSRRRAISRTQELARMTPGGKQAEITDSGHLVAFDRPDAIAEAIETVTAAMPGRSGDAPPDQV
jgi:pimeloyl-ACP methyl ester carboxylesterase